MLENLPIETIPMVPPAPSGAAPLMIDLYDEISLWSVRGIVAQLRSAPDAPVTLRINSPGGDVQEGFALASALRTHKGHKVAVVEGVCASAATFPACACDELHMHSESLLMIHNPWGGTAGGADDMESYADVLRKMTDLMVGMYQRKTGADEETVRGWMSRETWMTPQEAKDAGFCDAVISDDATAATARAKVRRFAAKLRLPPVYSKRNLTMKDTFRDKLAKHGLAEDGGNMEEAYSRYMSETEEGPDDRKAMAKAMEEQREEEKSRARAKAESEAEEEKKKKEADARAASEEPDGDDVKSAVKALERKLAAQAEKQAMMAKELLEARATLKSAADLSSDVADAKALDWAKAQISMGKVRADHKGKLEDTAKWLAAKYRKSTEEAEDVLSAEGTFQFSERMALQRLTTGGAGIGQPMPRDDELAAAGSTVKAIDQQMNRAIAMQTQKLKTAGKPATYDAAVAEVKRTDRKTYDLYMKGAN